MNFINKLRGKLFLLLTLWVCLSAPVSAQDIENLRSFHDSQKTRFVLDLSKRPDYSSSLAKDKSVLAIRVRNVDNSVKAPSSVALSKNSCVRSVEKKLDRKDVRYLFSLHGCDVPKIFLLAPAQGNSDYRLVIDIPRAKHAAASAAVVVSQEKKVSAQNSTAPHSERGERAEIDLSKPLSTYERDLFIEYSTSTKDGFRTMTPQNATLYNQKLKELREKYSEALVAREIQQSTKQRSTKNTAASTAGNTIKKENKHEEIEELVSDASAPPVPVQAKPVQRPFIIAVDAGHGGKDPGAIGRRGVREKNVTLAISKALYSYINSNRNFRGTLIRASDIFIDLDRRSEIARRRKADLLISIHADSVASGSSSARGASVLVLSENRAVRENGKILRNNKQNKLIGGAGEVMDQSVGNPYLATAILDMSSTNSRSEGTLLAKEILSSLGKFTHVRKSAPISASLAVLKSPDIPSLLIETGYLSNRYEEIQLNQPNYQKQIAYRIYLGIKSYYEKYPAQKIKSRQESYARSKVLANKKSITVKKGESLSIIARRYGTTVKAIRALNNLKSDSVNVGQVLYIP